jgi:hypothetical protein
MDNIISCVNVMCKDIEKTFGNCQWMVDCRPRRHIGSSPSPRTAIAEIDDNSVSRIMPSKPSVKGSDLVELSMDDVKDCDDNVYSNQVLSNRTYSSSFVSIPTAGDQMAGKEKLFSQKFSNSFGSARTVNSKANDGYHPNSSLSRTSSFTDGYRVLPVPSYKHKFAVLMDQARLNGEASTTRVQKAKREGRNQAEPSIITLIAGSGRSPRAPH